MSAVDQAKLRLAEGPRALILCDEPARIGLLRELRAGEIPRADSRTPVLVVGVDDDSAAVRYYRAGADVALPSESSELLVAAGLEALVSRAGSPQARVVRVGAAAAAATKVFAAPKRHLVDPSGSAALVLPQSGRCLPDSRSRRLLLQPGRRSLVAGPPAS